MVLVKYNAKNVYVCSSVKLIPGVNDVDSELLKLAVKSPLFKSRIDEGIIEILEEKKGKGKKTDNKQIIDLMNHTYDVKLLRKYISESDDEIVVKAAQKQLTVIESVEVKKEVEVGVTFK